MPAAAPALFVVGAGKAGRALVAAYAANGGKITGVYDCDSEKINSLKLEGIALYSGVAAYPAAQILHCESVVFAVSDDAVAAAAERLRNEAYEYLNANLDSKTTLKTAIHLSGALPSAALSPLSQLGVGLASMHPAASFSGGANDFRSFDGAVAALEGEPEAVQIARVIAENLRMSAFVIEADVKPLYHAACVLASNASVALADAARRAALTSGVPSETASRLVGSLMKTTAERTLNGASPAQALSGPFARGEIDVIAAELSALREKIPDAEETYRLLGLRLLEIAKIKNNGIVKNESEIKKMLL